MGAITATLDRSAGGARRGLNAFGRACLAAARSHRLYLAIIVLYALACVATGRIAGASEVVAIRAYAGPFLILIAVFAVAFALGHALWTAVAVRPKGSLIGAIGRDLRARILTAPRIAGFLVASALAPLFFSTFGSFKRLIPVLEPFAWDPAFASLDRWLHGGVDPWRLLQPVLGTPAVTSAVSFAYNLWFFVLFFTFIWQVMSLKRPQLRMQFLLAFLLCWIVLGTVLATVLSSAGPVYYGRITGLADPFAPLMHYLYAVHEQAPVWALSVQERLWTTYQAGGIDFGSGISAMPSLHVATSTLFALLGWRVNRLAGIAYTAFAVVILVGSVHLGWHYAIDGYLAAVLVAALWYGTGWALRRRARTGS